MSVKLVNCFSDKLDTVYTAYSIDDSCGLTIDKIFDIVFLLGKSIQKTRACVYKIAGYTTATTEAAFSLPSKPGAFSFSWSKMAVS